MHFTPARERARHEALIAGFRTAPLGRAAWVLCPRESVARRLLDGVARAGGGFVRVVGWEGLADALAAALGLPAVPMASETDRARVVERCLATLPALEAPLRSDPFGVALGLLSVVDTLRLHGWDGSPPADAVTAPADALLGVHLGQLGAVLRALQSGLAAQGQCDLIARIERVTRAVTEAGAGTAFPFASLAVDGLDRLAPRERALLDALAAQGVTVDLAPWVEGRPALPRDGDVAPPEADTWLAAVADGTTMAAPSGTDATVATVAVRDPFDEAETLARWVAEAVARGRDPETVAVAVSPEHGAAQRVARALARYGVASHGGGASPVQVWPLWQVVRASVRLGWRGVDVVDLATVLSAPGSGVWGSDRDWLCAQLRHAVPTGWKGVREVLHRATADPTRVTEPVDSADDEDGTAAPAKTLAPVDHDAERARAEQLATIRARVEELITLWETTGPALRLGGAELAAALRELVEATLARFVNPPRFREGLRDDRVAGAWVAAAGSIDGACRAALDRVDALGGTLPAHDPGAFLALVEPLLGMVSDGVGGRRGDGVALLADDPFPARRPEVLLVTGFHRGRFPSGVGRALLLGPLERDRLASRGGDLAELPDDAARGALALRETARMLSLPTQRVVLFWPQRTAGGGAVEPALAWRDLLALVPAAMRTVREAEGFVPGRRWLAREHPGAGATPRAAVLDAIAALGAGRVDEALALGRARAVADVAVRDLFAARFRPDRGFDVGDLVRQQVAEGVFTPRALETLLMCRYSFLTEHLLGLRPLRLARSPSLTVGDRTKITRAALRSLDVLAAEGIVPTEEDVKAALATAIAAHVPWGDRPDQRLALQELQRSVRTFLNRYLDLRRDWELRPEAEPPEATDAAGRALPVPITLDGGRTVKLLVQPPRVESRTGPAGDRAVVMDLRLGAVDRYTRLRDAGLDLDAALVPAVTGARGGADVGVFVRLSLSKPEGEALVPSRGDAGEGAGAGMARKATGTRVTVDPVHSLGSHRRAVLKSLGTVFDEIMDPGDPAGRGARYEPHDASRAQELTLAKARSCEYCGMKLGCRFGMAGGL